MSQEERLNCWEVKNCGCGPGGEKNLCPAAQMSDYEGINSGKFCGRFCWVITSTTCDECVQGSYVEKIKDCKNCDFFKQVSHEEGDDFIVNVTVATDNTTNASY